MPKNVSQFREQTHMQYAEFIVGSDLQSEYSFSTISMEFIQKDQLTQLS